jgi:hypothetical protein
LLVFDPAPDAGSDFVADLVGRFRDLDVASPFNRRVKFHALRA